MRWLRIVLAGGLAFGLAAAAVPALAAATRQLKGVLEKVDAADRHVVLRENGPRKVQVPLTVAKDAKVSTPAGPGSFASLHVGDEVTVHCRAGAQGEEATEVQVTKAAPAR